ncbi:MAG: PilW family protein [Limisphaerales bacterium]
MKLPIADCRLPIESRRAAAFSKSIRNGFTLIEMMVTMAVFMFVVIGMIDLHLFGLKLNNLVSVKLEATADARHALSDLVTEIHAAGVVRVGDGDATAFTEAAFDTAQEGNAIQIYPVKTDTNTFVRYFLDSSDNELKRIQSGGTNAPVVIAGWVTNRVIFTSEDFAGNILSNNFNNRVIGVDLEFYQMDNPMIQINQGQYYDYYRLQTRVTRRALE